MACLMDWYSLSDLTLINSVWYKIGSMIDWYSQSDECVTKRLAVTEKYFSLLRVYSTVEQM